MASIHPSLSIVFCFVSAHAILVIVLALRLNLRWRIAAWLAIASLCLQVTATDAGESFVNYQTGSAFGTVCFNALHLLLVVDPVVKWRHKTNETQLSQMPLQVRLYWVLCAAWNSRGVDWNYKMENIPALPKLGRSAFIFNRYLRIVWHAFLVDVCQSYMDVNPLFSLPGSGEKAQSLRSQGFAFNVLNVLAMFTPAYCMISISYDLLSIVAVALGITEPRTWPLIFGDWKEGYTVRRFWSRTWHQNMRRFVSGTGKAVARSVGCTPGTWLSARIQLFIGFSISGLAHVFGDTMVGRRFAGCSLPFFLLQACAITLEDFAIACGKRAGIRLNPGLKAVGFVWTMAWFYWSAPYFADWGLRAGMGTHRTFGWSVVRPVLQQVVGSTLFERVKTPSFTSNDTLLGALKI